MDEHIPRLDQRIWTLKHFASTRLAWLGHDSVCVPAFDEPQVPGANSILSPSNRIYAARGKPGDADAQQSYG